jgi:hypothetical protein
VGSRQLSGCSERTKDQDTQPLVFVEVGNRSRIHERTISLRFLGKILRFLRLEVFMDFLEGGAAFYQAFLLSPLQCIVTHLINCKRLREFEEI